MNFRKNRSICTFLFCLLCSMTLISCQPSPDSSKVLTEGKKDFNCGNYQNTIDLLRPYVYYHPEDYEAHFFLGRSYLLMSSNEENKLYKARYYLSKARDLADSKDQRQAADKSYKQAKSLMGKEEIESAKDLHSSAEEALSLNKKELAINLYLKAANLYMLDENYGKAQKYFTSGLDIALNLKAEDNTKYWPSLCLGLATAYLLDQEPKECRDTLAKYRNYNISKSPMSALDLNFLSNASNLLLINNHRKILNLLDKNLNEKDEQNFVELFDKLARFQQKESHEFSKDKAILFARVWYLIAEHSDDLNMLKQADLSFTTAQELYLSAGLKDEALDIGKKIDDIKKHSKT